jgi:transposase-like protein
VAQDYLAGETLHGLAKCHEISRNLVRIWVAKYEAGPFDNDVVAADMVQTQEARIAALERLVGKLVLENRFLKGASRDAPRPRSETMPIITGPVTSRLAMGEVVETPMLPPCVRRRRLSGALVWFGIV